MPTLTRRLRCLLEVGYPHVATATVAERLKKLIWSSSNIVIESIRNKRIVGIPQIHFLPHRLKKVEGTYGVHDVFTAASKPHKLCASMQKKNEQDTRWTDICFVSHLKKFTDCHTGVAYNVPVSCGHCYRAASCCVNERLMKDKGSLNRSLPCNLSLHC